MTKTFKVSVIVPVHNTEKYLRTCVESLLAQTLKDIEIILVENASTDGSLALCRELEAMDKRIRTVSLELGDLSNARNEGIKVACGDFVGFADSDDTVAPDMYEQLYNAAIQNEVDVASCNLIKIYPDHLGKQQFPDDGKQEVLTSKEALSATFNKRMPISACVFIVRKYIAEKYPFPVKRSMEDMATTYKYYSEVTKSVYIHKSFYFYHQYRGNIMKNYKTFKHSYDMEIAKKEILSFINNYAGFTKTEKINVSKKQSRALVRQLNRMRKAASTKEEKAIYKECKKDLSIIPAGSIRHPLLSLLRFFMMYSIGNF